MNNVIVTVMKEKKSGRKPKYNEPTVVISFRCPASKKDEMRLHVAKRLMRIKNHS
jgi:hypothetical protein